MKDGILVRVPWGYATRFITILANPATSTLPTFTTTIQIGAGSDMTPETTELTFDIGDMVTGGAALLASIEDPNHGKTAREIFEPIIKLVVALSVIITIVMDLMGSHKHAQENNKGNVRL